jgi:uncharacterized protein YdbL (DUF1318 family)
VLDDLEDALVSADVETNQKIIDNIEKRAKDKYHNIAELNGILKQEIEMLLVNPCRK